jgi:hypothetical protein
MSASATFNRSDDQARQREKPAAIPNLVRSVPVFVGEPMKVVGPLLGRSLNQGSTLWQEMRIAGLSSRSSDLEIA